MVEWFCSLKLKKYIPQRTISLEISQRSFSNTFGRLLPWNKQPSRSNRPKEFLETAVLKYLRKLPRNYQSYNVLVAKIKKRLDFLEFFLNSYSNISGRLHLWNRKPSRRCHQIISEAAVWRCSLKQLFWKIRENSQEITRGGVLLMAKIKTILLGIF